MSLFPRYKVRQREVLAWLFTACMKIDLEPKITLSLRHANKGFLKRFMQLVRLGMVKWTYLDLNTNTWQLDNLEEITFFLRQIKPHLRTQREKRVAELLIEHCEASNPETEAKLKPLLKAHNLHFYLTVY